MVDDQVGCPTYTGHLAPALVEIAERGLTGVLHVAGGGRCSWFDLANATFEETGLAVPRQAAEHGRRRPARPAPGVLRAGQHPRRCPRAAGLARRPQGPPGPRGGGGMKLLVCGGAGFIGSNFVRIRARPGRRGHRAGQAHLRGPAREPRRTSTSASWSAASRTPTRSPTRSRAATRSSTSPPRRTSTARSPSRTRSSPRTPSAPTRCSRPPASAACATSRSRPTRSTARSSPARSPRSRRCSRPRPYSATKAGADLLVASYRHTYGLEALICRGSNNYGPYQYPEKLIPLMVLNALHGDKLPVYGDGMQVRNWIYVEDFARGIGTVLERGEPGEVYNVGGPDEAPNIEVVQAHHRVHGRRRVADRVRHRPARPRPPLLARLREGAGARLGAAGALRRGPRADGRLVPRQRWWWEPIRSGDYRAYYERQYGRALG